MSKVIFLSCTKSKLDKPSPAKDLYSASPMFQKTLEYGKSLKPDKMFILSAKHHLVPMDKVLSPYDLTLKDMKSDEKEKWGETVLSQIKKVGLNPEKDNFIFLTGSEYMKPLTKSLKNIENPLNNKKFGERLKWLNSKIEAKINELKINIKNLINETIRKYYPKTIK
jgi:hypothetical protein